MAYRSSSIAGTSGNVNPVVVPVPAGAAVGDIAVVAIYDEGTNAITPPAGFTLKVDLSTSAATRGRLAIYWKRLTAADTGTYDFAGTPTWRHGACALFSGRVATGDPFTATSTVEPTGNSTTITLPALTAASGDDLAAFLEDFEWANTVTPPGTMTEQLDQDTFEIATQDNVTAGSTGTRAFTYSAATIGKGFLGALAVAASSNDGTVAATLPKVTGSIAGTSTDAGTLSADLPKVTASLTGTSTNAGTLVATLAAVVGSIAGTVVDPGTLDATLPKVTGSITGTMTNSGTLSAQLPKVTGSISSQTSTNDGTLSATLPKVTGSLAGTSTDPGTLAGVLPKVTGSIVGTQTNAGTLSAALPKVVGAVSDQATVLGTLAATLPKVTAALVGSSTNPATTNGTLPKVTGSIAGTSRNPGVTAATLPAAVGSLVGVMTNSGSLVGILPKVTGSVLDFVIPPLPTTGVSITIDAGTRGLSVTTEARDMEVTA